MVTAYGPLTNLALAIRLDPDFAALAKELVFNGALMGTAFDLNDGGSNAENTYDFNMLFDPEAAHIVLTAPWHKITAVGNVTLDTMMTSPLVDRVASKVTPVTRYLKQYVEHIPLWDEMTAAIAIDPSLVTKQVDVYMDIDINQGANYGAAHVWPDRLTPHLGERKVTLIQKVDVERFLNQFVKAAQFDAPGN